MRDSVMWFLVSSVVISALFVVNIRHEHRISYLAFQTEEARRDALNDEWGQLLIEENLWAFPHRIERDASKHLSMRAPVKGDIKFVGMDDTLIKDETLVKDYTKAADKQSGEAGNGAR